MQAYGPQVLCFMTLEVSPHYRGGSCAICTGLGYIVHFIGGGVRNLAILLLLYFQCLGL